MSTQQNSFDERSIRFETEVADVKTLLGESATVQAQMLNMLNAIGRRTEDIARHLGVPRRNGSA